MYNERFKGFLKIDILSMSIRMNISLRYKSISDLFSIISYMDDYSGGAKPFLKFSLPIV